MREFFDGKYTSGDIHPKIWEATYRNLSKGVTDGFGKIEYKDNSIEVVNELKTNVAVYAAFKAHAQGKELAQMLVDENGKQRSWNEFRKAATSVDSKYNQQWLEAEFNQATRAARSAKQWGEIQKTKDTYPNLEYIESRSGTPRDDHKRFYGVVKPIDDAFWNRMMPPNGWGCKCSVRPTRAKADGQEIEPVEAIPGVSGNAGKDSQVFSKTHPIVSSESKKSKARIQAIFTKLFNLEDDYARINIGKGKTVDVHVNADKQDVIENLRFGTEVVKKFKGNFKVRAHSKTKKVKNPEMEWNGVIGDITKPEDSKSVKNYIDNTFKSKLSRNKKKPGQMSALKKCWVGLDFKGELNSDNAERSSGLIHAKIKRYDNLSFLILKNESKTIKVDRNVSKENLLAQIKKELL